MESRAESIDLAQLLQEVLGFTGNEALHRNITVTQDFANGIPPIRADRGQLQQIFLNIINNAFAAVADGGRVDLILKRTKTDRVAVVVRDNGSGIPEDKLPYIFEPFFSMKGKFGTGLGLSITYDLVQKMGAHINISSRLDEGTAVTVEFPASSASRGEI
jgi:signal transduction histidine kinase